MRSPEVSNQSSLFSIFVDYCCQLAFQVSEYTCMHNVFFLNYSEGKIKSCQKNSTVVINLS